LLAACTNPFAPEINYDDSSTSGGISDLTVTSGIFENLQKAYAFKDTLIYGEMIASDFVFTYRDYEMGFDVTWGREDEMKTTAGLFQNSERLNLIWNNVISSSEDSLNASIIRSFNLTITFNPADIVRVDGRANLTLRRNTDTGKWQIVKWVDESGN